MLINNSVYRESYVGNGVQTQFPVLFPFLQNAHLAVDLQNPTDAVPTRLTLNTHYTVTGAGVEAGGVVTLLTAPVANAKLVIYRNVPYTQEYKYNDLDNFPAESHENALALLTMQCQQLQEQVDRALMVNSTSDVDPSDLINSLLVSEANSAASAASAASQADRATVESNKAKTEADRAKTEADRAKVEADNATVTATGVTAAVNAAKADILASAAFVPIGAVLDFPVNTVPAGFLICAGQTVTKEAYPDLVAYLTGSSMALSAVLPDYRGEFRRGADLGRGVDAGRAVGSAQNASIQNHYHDLYATAAGMQTGSSNYRLSGTTTNQDTNLALLGVGETRPRNVAVVACIKAYHAPMSAAPVDMTSILARLNAIETSGAEAKRPQTIMRCKLKAPLASPFHDLALPDFLTFSGLNVTLLADPATPFAACFGNGGTSVVGELTGNLSVVLPNTAGTHWLYLDRNPVTGALTLGSTLSAPEYAGARRVGTGDWYSPPENIMRDAADAQVQRVYVGKAVVSSGAVTSVVPFHPGCSTIIPMNSGNVLANSTNYITDNPFGINEPYITYTPQYYGANMISWGVSPEYIDSSGFGLARRRATVELFRMGTGSGGAGLDDSGAVIANASVRARIIVERRF